jgi:glutaredoxin
VAIESTHVPGRDAGRVLLYALSTCVWCKKTKALLRELGVAFEYIDVDLLESADRRITDEQVKKWNPRRNYPTIVIDEAECIAGFDEVRIRERLGP